MIKILHKIVHTIFHHFQHQWNDWHSMCYTKRASLFPSKCWAYLVRKECYLQFVQFPGFHFENCNKIRIKSNESKHWSRFATRITLLLNHKTQWYRISINIWTCRKSLKVQLLKVTELRYVNLLSFLFGALFLPSGKRISLPF